MQVGHFFRSHGREAGNTAISIPAGFHNPRWSGNFCPVGTGAVLLFCIVQALLHFFILSGIIADRLVNFKVGYVTDGNLSKEGNKQKRCYSRFLKFRIVKQGQDNGVDNDKDQAEQNSAATEVGRTKFFCQYQEGPSQKRNRQNVPSFYFMNVLNCICCNNQQQENVGKGLAIGQIIRIMESMPDVVQHVQVEGKVVEGYHYHASYFFT